MVIALGEVVQKLGLYDAVSPRCYPSDDSYRTDMVQEIIHAIQSDLGYTERRLSTVVVCKDMETNIPDIYPGIWLIMTCIRVVKVSKTAML